MPKKQVSKSAILGRVDPLALCFSVARCSPRTLAVLSCARLLVFLFGIMALVDYNSKAAGATYAAKYGALDEDGYVWVPKSARFMDAVAQAQQFRSPPRLAISKAKTVPRDERISCDGAG